METDEGAGIKGGSRFRIDGRRSGAIKALRTREDGETKT